MDSSILKLLNIGWPVKIIVDAAQYDLEKDNRFLIPFIVYKHNEILFGFADKIGNIVISAKYDRVFDDFHNSDELVRVGRRVIIDCGAENNPRQYTYFRCGLINSKGEELISCERYMGLDFADDEKTLLIAYGNHREKYGCSLIDIFGNEIIPYGKYSRIERFYNGMARVRKNIGWHEEKYGLVNKRGEEIAPLGTGPSSFGWYRNPKSLKFYTEKYGAFI